MSGSPDAAPAFEAFVLGNGPELLRFARRLTLDHHRAEDMVQDVLARIGLSWARNAGIDDLRAYAYRAVLNEFLSWRRRRSSAEAPVADVSRGRSAPAPAPDAAVIRHEDLRVLLARLPRVQRAVLVLRYYLDLPDDRIAALMGIGESTVRSHARRGLTAMRAVGDHLSEELRR